jgi:hypothetical protein
MKKNMAGGKVVRRARKTRRSPGRAGLRVHGEPENVRVMHIFDVGCAENSAASIP